MYDDDPLGPDFDSLRERTLRDPRAHADAWFKTEQSAEESARHLYTLTRLAEGMETTQATHARQIDEALAVIQAQAVASRDLLTQIRALLFVIALAAIALIFRK